jgi:hypothetical protein
MKYIAILFLIVLCAGCNNQGKNKPVPETTTTRVDTVIKTDPVVAVPAVAADSLLLQLSKTILTQLKTAQYGQLVPLIHPVYGIRFSPYAYIDTIHDNLFSREKFVSLVTQPKKIRWGSFDGSGEPIFLDWAAYVKRFVYDKDFLNAPKNTVNAILGEGNSLNNLKTIYPDCDFTEFYFPGFDPRYNGMDWKTLRLVFKKDKDAYYLVGVVHDEWTT